MPIVAACWCGQGTSPGPGSAWRADRAVCGSAAGSRLLFAVSPSVRSWHLPTGRQGYHDQSETHGTTCADRRLGAVDLWLGRRGAGGQNGQLCAWQRRDRPLDDHVMQAGTAGTARTRRLSSGMSVSPSLPLVQVAADPVGGPLLQRRTCAGKGGLSLRPPRRRGRQPRRRWYYNNLATLPSPPGRAKTTTSTARLARGRSAWTSQHTK